MHESTSFKSCFARFADFFAQPFYVNDGTLLLAGPWQKVCSPFTSVKKAEEKTRVIAKEAGGEGKKSFLVSSALVE